MPEQCTTIRNSSSSSSTTTPTNNISTTTFRSFLRCFVRIASFCFVRSFIRSVGRSYCHIKIIHSSALNAIIVPLSLKANNNRVHTAAAAQQQQTTKQAKGNERRDRKKRVFMLCDRFINVCTRLVRAAALLCAVENKLAYIIHFTYYTEQIDMIT